MKLSLLVENKTYNDQIQAEHGLSLLIETDEKTILFDAGETDLLIRNAQSMDIDLTKVDFAVLSHGHSDHSGGFPDFHKVNPEAKIYIQQNALKESFELGHDGLPLQLNIGVQWTEKEKAELSDSLVFTTGPVYITPNIVISGSIPEEIREYNSEQFLVRNNEGFEPDKMEHEQFLIIRENNQLYVFSGCSHNGIVPVIKYTNQLFPNNEIKLIFGGFHLYQSKYDPLLSEVNRITSLDTELFMPVHCTGLLATHRMMDVLGDRCIIMNAGEKEYL